MNSRERPTIEFEHKHVHRGITMQQGMDLLRGTNRNGSFLVRQSETIDCSYALCILVESRVLQYRIIPRPDGTYSFETRNPKYKSNDLSQLICEFIKNGKHNGLAGPLLYLVQPSNMSEDDNSSVKTPQDLRKELKDKEKQLSDMAAENEELKATVEQLQSQLNVIMLLFAHEENWKEEEKKANIEQMKAELNSLRLHLTQEKQLKEEKKNIQSRTLLIEFRRQSSALKEKLKKFMKLLSCHREPDYDSD